jgi:hypothetical protein
MVLGLTTILSVGFSLCCVGGRMGAKIERDGCPVNRKGGRENRGSEPGKTAAYSMGWNRSKRQLNMRRRKAAV